MIRGHDDWPIRELYDRQKYIQKGEEREEGRETAVHYQR